MTWLSEPLFCSFVDIKLHQRLADCRRECSVFHAYREWRACQGRGPDQLQLYYWTVEIWTFSDHSSESEPVDRTLCKTKSKTLDGQRNPQSRSHSTKRVQQWWVMGGMIRDSWIRMYTVNSCPQSSTCILHDLRDSSVIIISSSLIFFSELGMIDGHRDYRSDETRAYHMSWEISLKK